MRSNGTVTYVGKDIANQFWKFGLLGRDFYYRVFEKRDGHPLWATTSEPGQAQGVPTFGRASAVYNVIDSRQAYLQQLLKQALATMGFTEQADRSTHFSYDMVALSHATASALGYATPKARAKRSSKCPDARDSASRPTTCSIASIDTAGREVASRNPETRARRIGGGSRRSSPSPPCATF